MTSTLCMLISNPRFAIARQALVSATMLNKPAEVVLGIRSDKLQQQWGEKLRLALSEAGGADIPIRLLTGAEDRDEVALARQRLYSTVETDWIINLDDDDGALGPLPVDSVGDRVATIHTAILAVCRVATGPRQAGDVFVRPARKISDPQHANFFRGSYYAYRTAAWKQIAPLLGPATAYEEWRTVWHLIRSGGLDHYCPEILQWQSVEDYVAEAEATQTSGLSWGSVVAEMTAAFGAGSRWWQNWDNPEHRRVIEKYWRTSKEQPARRQIWYRQLETISRAVYGARGLAGQQIVDYGCGTAEDFHAFSAMGVKYNGADVTPGMLELARAKYPGIRVSEDDMLASKFKDRQWPTVICNAVLPHLPEEHLPRAISELWRISDKLLVIRLFGVGQAGPNSKDFVHEGFLYHWWPAERWIKLITDNAPGATIKAWDPVKTDRTTIARDCLVVTACRE